MADPCEEVEEDVGVAVPEEEVVFVDPLEIPPSPAGGYPDGGKESPAKAVLQKVSTSSSHVSVSSTHDSVSD